MVKGLKNGPTPQSPSQTFSYRRPGWGPAIYTINQLLQEFDAGDPEAAAGETAGERQRSDLGRKKSEGQLKEFLTLEQ